MSEENNNLTKRLGEIDAKLTELSQLHKSFLHDPKNILEQLYLSPRTLLVFITLLNVALFIGGTVYTGVQVDSIQKRYADASIKIMEAKQKYDEADSKLKSIQAISDDTRAKLSDIQQKADASIADLQKRSRDSAEGISSIRSKSEQELDLLKKSIAATLVSLNTYQRDTEERLQKAAADVGIKLEHEIQSNKEAIMKKQASIDALGPQIDSLSAKVDQKTLELAKIQKGLEDQLGTATKLNAEFMNKVKAIARVDKITVPVAFRITDIWLKVLFGVIVVITLLSAVLVIRK